MKTYTKLTVVFTCLPIREPVEYTLDGVDNTEQIKEDFVKSKVAGLTTGCNYKYSYLGCKSDYYFFE